MNPQLWTLGNMIVRKRSVKLGKHRLQSSVAPLLLSCMDTDCDACAAERLDLTQCMTQQSQRVDLPELRGHRSNKKASRLDLTHMIQ